MRKTLALVGTVVNVFAPGIGSLIMGKFASGAIQLSLLLIVWLLKLVSFGLLGGLLWPVTAIVWLWAVGGGVLTYFSLPDHHKALRP
ncbi:hypothetical protein [Sulfobacillus thermosulfidooxidans]|uniref:hypothetical protein n=1 Tax=Sulfobacillus thermosulfidooxidans TaxID=28034 RepID=UPI0006B668DE|nr:hypothetical protein [Sulfobacillus thermosulfidooxidans]